jgi:hypothetical protein
VSVLAVRSLMRLSFLRAFVTYLIYFVVVTTAIYFLHRACPQSGAFLD